MSTVAVLVGRLVVTGVVVLHGVLELVGWVVMFLDREQLFIIVVLAEGNMKLLISRQKYERNDLFLILNVFNFKENKRANFNTQLRQF